jgi:hypothetical protein
MEPAWEDLCEVDGSGALVDAGADGVEPTACCVTAPRQP